MKDKGNNSSGWMAIDFGTTNSVAAIDLDGAPRLVGNGSSTSFPTVACVLEDGTVMVCHEAELLRLSHPETFKQEFKLQIADPIDINSADYTDIVTAILSHIKGFAEIEGNGAWIEKVVLTVPASYTASDSRKEVMRKAALRSGFKEIEFMGEPVAAALHYADVSGDKEPGLILVYDLGGGTFDAALLEISMEGEPRLIGKESGGKCGGQYFDRAIYRHFADKCKENGKPLVRSEKISDYRSARMLKETLSVKQESSQHFSNGEMLTLRREELEKLVAPLIDETLASCDSLITSAGHQWSDLRRILLVGGSSAIPLIKTKIDGFLKIKGASGVEIIRSLKGEKREYSNVYASALGAVSSKILPPPPEEEKPGTLITGGRSFQLKPGENKVGRSAEMDIVCEDPSMSRHHFSIHVDRKEDGKILYILETKSGSGPTVVNNMEALDLRFAGISRVKVRLLDGFTITAGKTKFQIKFS